MRLEQLDDTALRACGPERLIALVVRVRVLVVRVRVLVVRVRVLVVRVRVLVVRVRVLVVRVRVLVDAVRSCRWCLIAVAGQGNAARAVGDVTTVGSRVRCQVCRVVGCVVFKAELRCWRGGGWFCWSAGGARVFGVSYHPPLPLW